MRPLWKDILAAVWLGIVIPGIVLHAAVLAERVRPTETPQPTAAETVPEPAANMLLRQTDETVISMDRETYLTGVVLAEMPSDFHPEALKAQSVAARTYARKAEITGGKHGDGSLCGDSGCCQAYLTEQGFLSRGGTEAALEKVRLAVAATEPFVLVYEDELIEAVYFSSSGGKTEAAVAVWGAEFPYLQSVDSPGEEGARYHTDSLLIPSGEFSRLLGVELPEDSAVWFGAVKYTEGGGVETMEIAGKTFSGTELRALLGLRSTAFTMEPAGEYIRIATRGYGHRVGMSQYGANAMALTGHTWQQILQHYYPGTVIVPAA